MLAAFAANFFKRHKKLQKFFHQPFWESKTSDKVDLFRKWSLTGFICHSSRQNLSALHCRGARTRRKRKKRERERRELSTNLPLLWSWAKSVLRWCYTKKLQWLEANFCLYFNQSKNRISASLQFKTSDNIWNCFLCIRHRNRSLLDEATGSAWRN